MLLDTLYTSVVVLWWKELNFFSNVGRFVTLQCNFQDRNEFKKESTFTMSDTWWHGHLKKYFFSSSVIWWICLIKVTLVHLGNHSRCDSCYMNAFEVIFLKSRRAGRAPFQYTIFALVSWLIIGCEKVQNCVNVFWCFWVPDFFEKKKAIFSIIFCRKHQNLPKLGHLKNVASRRTRQNTDFV